MNFSSLTINKDHLLFEIKPKASKLQQLYAGISIVLILVFIFVCVTIWQRAAQGLSFFLGWKETALVLLITGGIVFSFFRSWIWYAKGKEVIKIYKNKISYYRSMYLYKEGRKEKDFNDINVLFSQAPKDENSEELDESLVDDLMLDEEASIVGFQLNNDEVISTFLPIAQSKIKELDAAIKVLRYKIKSK